MGLYLFRRSCSLNPTNPSAVAPNPDPSQFKILRAQNFGRALVIEVHYHGCTNYDGNKIIVYSTAGTLAELLATTQNRLDPHFNTTWPSPVARFEPTGRGWQWACELAAALAGPQTP